MMWRRTTTQSDYPSRRTGCGHSPVFSSHTTLPARFLLPLCIAMGILSWNEWSIGRKVSSIPEKQRIPLLHEISPGRPQRKILPPTFYAISPRSKEWKALWTLFFDKWHTLLSNNEFNYQMEHIEQLCEDFYRIQLALAKNLPVRGWLTPRLATSQS